MPAAKKSASSNTKKSKNSKSSASKNKNNTSAKTNKETRRYWSYVLFFCGLIQIFMTYVKGEDLWLKFFNVNRGLFGLSVFFIGPLVMYVSFQIASDKPGHTIAARIIQGFILLLFFSATAEILFGELPATYNISTKISCIYKNGVQLCGGGIIGSVIGLTLLSLFKKTGATIIILLLDFTFIMLLTNLTPNDIVRFIVKPFSCGYKIVSNDRAERAIQHTEKINNQQIENDNKNCKNKKEKTRVDIAKYYQDDLPDENNNKSDNKNNNAFDNSDKLEKLIAEAVAGDNNSDNTDNKNRNNNKLKNRKSTLTADKKQNTDSKNDTLIYEYPPFDLLKYSKNISSPKDNQAEIADKSSKLVETFEDFGIKTKIVGISRGPAVTRYEIQPGKGVSVKQITNRADDIALNLATNGVRIAQVPGKAAIGIEVPNIYRDSVSLRELIDSDDYKNAESKLSFAVGKDIDGNIVMGDIATMPHMLIAGTTGSGKSVFTNSVILNILFHASPDEVKLILIDPKKVEFPMYNGIPHLLIPVVTDPLKAAGALGWAVNEMMRRYNLFEANGVKNLEDFNQFVDENPDLEYKKLHYIVIVIDEFADLMLAAKSEVEESVMRLAQLARAAGMHMLIATQSPRTDVITGLIKANIPSRTALSVSSNVDSRVILDEVGAEELLGRGDLLYKPVGYPKPKRIQSGFATTQEIRNIVNFLKNEKNDGYDEQIIHDVDKAQKNIEQTKNKNNSASDNITLNPDDDLINQAITLIVETGNASTAFLQRKLKLGFPRAARIMDDIEEMGIIGPQEGSKPRKIYITKEEWYERRSMN